MAILICRISSVWHQVGEFNYKCRFNAGCQQSDHFRHSSGARVRLKGKNLGTSATVRLIEDIPLMRCPLNTGFTVSDINFEKRCYQSYLFLFSSLISVFPEGLTDSVIVGDNVHHLANLSTWLKPVAQSESSKWKRCWRASVDGWAASTFHSGCDNKGPTVTIIRVGGKYIFGGYTNVSWVGK